MCATLRIICGYTRQSERTEFGRDFLLKRSRSIRSLFKSSSESKDKFSLVADEFVSLCILLKSVVLFLLFVLLFSGLIVEDLTTAATSPTEIAMFPSLFVTRSARPASQKHAEFRHNFSFKRGGSIRSLFRITKRFKRPIWFCSWGT